VLAGILGFYDLIGGRSGWKGGLKWASSWGIWALSYTSVGSFTAAFTQYSPGKRRVLTTDMELVKVDGQDKLEAIWAAGFQYNLLQSLVKGRVDSQRRASLFIEEKFNDVISALFCVELDWKKDQYKVGVGASVTS